ncbi:MAG: sodium/solute symporter [Lentisphaerae bacterium]|nr:sodium/solute symporter [Lentisphaerota bacterium]
MQFWDLITISIYFIVTIGIGLAAARKRASRTEFLLADKSIGWFPLGISVAATVFSAVNFVAFSGEVMTNGLYVLMVLPAFLLVIRPVTHVLIPFYRHTEAVTAYEFLEKRFDQRVRRLAAALFVVWRMTWVSVILYATAKLLSSMLNIDFRVIILMIGSLTIAYTMLGGMRAVIWTDVAQGAIIMAALFSGIIVVSIRGDGFFGVFSLAVKDDLIMPFYPFDPMSFSLDPRIRMTFWSCLIGGSTAFFSRYSADQMIVQRYLTARSLKDATRGFVLSIVFSLAALVGLVILGLAIHAHNPSGATAPPMSRIAGFILSLPAGVTGLLIAALFASTMSSVDSGIHSACTALTSDFSANPGYSSVFSNRVFTLIIGIMSSIAACFIGRLGSIFEIMNKIINGFGSPLLAIILFGIYGRRASSRGILLGGILGAIWSILASSLVVNLALHYYAVVNLIGTAAFCHISSLVFPDHPLDRNTVTQNQ